MSNKKPKCFRQDHHSWVTYERSFVATVGMIFMGIALYAETYRPADSEEQFAIFVICGLIGGFFLTIALIGKNGLMRSFLEFFACIAHHEVALIPFIVAFPLYFVASRIEKLLCLK